MSAAVLRIQVDGLTDVPDGYGRTDGVPNALVTVSSRGSGLTHIIRFWDVSNPLVTGSTPTAPLVPTLSPAGDGRTWTFTPPGGAEAYGQSFGIELVVDEGLDSEERSRHIYAIPTRNQQLRLPVFGEGADREASLRNHTTLQVARSADNAGGNWRGVHPAMLRWMAVLDQWLGLEYMSPSPQSPSGDSSTPTHVGTIEFIAGTTLFEVAGDLGDSSNGAEPTVLTIRRQADAALLATVTVTQLKLWFSHTLGSPVVFTSDTPCEIFVHSSNSSGAWNCKGLRFATRLS